MSSILQKIRLAGGGGIRGPFAKYWLGLVTLLSVLGVTLTTLVVLSTAQPAPPPPTCVSCPAGYHCAHNPERCVKN